MTHDETLQKFLDRLTEQPSRLHHQVYNIAESCRDQLKDLMPGCKVRVIVEDAEMEAHHNQEKIANGAGVSHLTKVEFSENEYLLLTTETND
jgi:hypothetical protein